jgi:hypothetical protein
VFEGCADRNAEMQVGFWAIAEIRFLAPRAVPAAKGERPQWGQKEPFRMRS